MSNTSDLLATRGTRIYDIRERLKGDRSAYPVGTELRTHGRIWLHQFQNQWIEITNGHNCATNKTMERMLTHDRDHEYLGRQIGWTTEVAPPWQRDAYTALQLYRQAAGVPVWFLTRLAPAAFYEACDSAEAVPTLQFIEETYAYLKALATGTPHHLAAPLADPVTLTDMGYIAAISTEIHTKHLRPEPLAAKAGLPYHELMELVKGERRPHIDDLTKLATALGVPIDALTADAQEFAKIWGA